MFTATLRNWTVAVGGPTCLPEAHRGQRVLMGTAYGHTHWDVRDGAPVRTNAIVRQDGNTVYTASGSAYVLDGPACEDFKAWLADQPAGFRGAVRDFIPVQEVER